MAPLHWLVQLFIAVDQLLNVLVTPFDGGAWADETMSCRAWRMWVKRRPFGLFFRPLIDALFIWQTWRMDHCARAYANEQIRYNMPPEFRR